MKKEFELSSGNVFADLNLPNPEEALTKAELARQINRVTLLLPPALDSAGTQPPRHAHG